MLSFVLLLTAGYLMYLAWERYVNDKCLASFRWVIHVNGIRGKTSVCRLIDAHLRGAGYRVFTKTTGSSPRYLDTEGVEHEIKRRGPANIKEQLAAIRMARRQNAEVLILECMAVQPALQEIAQERIVKGTVNVITNVRYDHTYELGGSLDAIAESLSGTIPRGGVLFTADAQYFDFFSQKCGEKGSRAVLCGGDGLGENEAIAVAVGDHLGVPPEDFSAHLQGYHADFGAFRVYRASGVPFMNLFSANDPQSTRSIFARYGGDAKDVVFVYNHRADRLDRLELFIRYFFADVPCRKILLIGQNKALAQRLLRRAGHANVEIARRWEDALTEEAGLLVGIGNIKGDASALLAFLEEKEGGA